MPSKADASLVFAADMTPLNQGLNQGANNLRKTMDNMKKTADDKSKDMFKGVKDKFGGFFSGLGFGAIFNGFNDIGKHVRDMVNGAKAFRDEMERAASISAGWDRFVARGIATSGAKIDSVADPKAKLKIIEEEILKTEKLRDTHKNIAEHLKGERKALEEWSGPGTTRSWQLWLGGGWERSLNKKEEEIKEATKHVEKYREELEKLNEMKLHLKNPATDFALQGEVNKWVEEMRNQIDFAGMSPMSAKIAGLIRRGASGGNLGEAIDMAQIIEKRQTPVVNVPGVLKNSLEDLSIMNKFNQQGVIKQEVEAMKQQLNETKQMKQILRDIHKAVLGIELGDAI
jgi:hypothetical protein